MGYVYILLTILFTVYGQLIIKQQISLVSDIPTGAGLGLFLIEFIVKRPLVISGFVSALLASMAWIAALSKFDLSFAYPFMSLTFIVVVLLSALLFNEELNSYKIIGLCFICFGVFVVSRGA